MTDLTYLSLGAGVQSSALLVLANQGKVERPSVAIFADTGDEPQYVYDYLEVLEAWSGSPSYWALMLCAPAVRVLVVMLA